MPPVMTIRKMICLTAGAALLLCATAFPLRAATKKPAAPTGRQKISTIVRDPYVGAISIDAATGRVLFEDRADARAYPASVLKLMDMLILLERIERGQLTLSEPVLVSARAEATGGTQVYLAEHESFPVDEMLYALMIQSANDAAVALAEKVAGTCEAFEALMNQRARELGMNNTVFNSVHGLPPSAGQQPDLVTARDLSILCRELLKHPKILQYTSTAKRRFRPEGAKGSMIMQNHDHLLGKIQGCDGLKTGYYPQAGYAIALTAQRNGQRVITVVLGSPNIATRDAKAAELINSAFVKLAQFPPPPAPQQPVAAPAPQGPLRPGSPSAIPPVTSGATKPLAPGQPIPPLVPPQR